MHVQNFPTFSRIPQPARIQGIIPIDFGSPDNDPPPDPDMNPNPNGFTPNWSLVGKGVAAGVAGGLAAGALGSSALQITPWPLMAVGALAGAYVGGNIALILSCKDR